MRRRQFLALAGSAISTWPLRASAQDAAGPPTIGFLGSGTASSQRDEAAAFTQRLGELGADPLQRERLVWLGGRPDRALRRNRRRICCEQGQCHRRVRTGSGRRGQRGDAGTFRSSLRPSTTAGTGVVKSLGRPGGNATGLSMHNPELAGKRLELLTQGITGIRRLAILVNGRYPAAAIELSELRNPIGKLGLRSYVREIRRTGDIATVLRTSADTPMRCMCAAIPSPSAVARRSPRWRWPRACRRSMARGNSPRPEA